MELVEDYHGAYEAMGPLLDPLEPVRAHGYHASRGVEVIGNHGLCDKVDYGTATAHVDHLASAMPKIGRAAGRARGLGGG